MRRTTPSGSSVMEKPGLMENSNGEGRARAAWLGWRAVSAQKNWGSAAIVCLGVVTAGIGMGVASHRWGTGYFPRQPSEFLSPQELDRRLERAAQELKADPNDARALAESGILYYQKGKSFYPDAINELEEAWRLGSLDPRLFYYLGAMYQDEGLSQFAVLQFQRFLRNRPEDKEVHLLLAKLLYQNQRFEDALLHYQWFAQRYRKDSVIAENMALCFLALKRRDEAAAAFRDLADQGGIAARRADYHLGQMAFEDQKYDQSREYFSHVLPVENEYLGAPPAAVHGAIAANFAKLEQWADAQAQWEDVLRFDPKNSHAKSELRAAKAALKKAAKQKKTGNQSKYPRSLDGRWLG